MRAKHITSQLDYRDPFGAVELGDSVTLSIDVWEEPEATAQLRIWIDGEGETLVDMEPQEHDDCLRFSATYTPEQTEIIWYCFYITAEDGAVWRYGARPGCSVGEGAFAFGDPPSFQITVYKRREVQPEWYQDGIVYQIFPDRFARGDDWQQRVRDALEPKRKGPSRDLVVDWNTPPTYRKDEYGRISVWDFYGGTLEGVREKLVYLKGLGVTVIYLNPIFEAASNHRYDTADYMRIDPMLGDEASFKRLCEDARKLGIRIILDGVFNHTGCDSRYFNKYGNYSDVGAFESDDSPYRSWYKFSDKERDDYQSWWGVDDLPDVDELDPDYHEFICGKDGVVRKWLRLGASGWRLDVADELPDSFIADIKAAALAEKPDAVVIGEVWEDASNKISYGELRRYLQGDELDGPMNYPFRTALLNFLTEKGSAFDLANALETLHENYPRQAFYSCLNLLGSHDRERLLTMLAGAPETGTLDDEQRRGYRLNEGQRGLAVSRLWVAALLQMTLPGVPSVYYGDEAGLEGYTDPYNRAPYPWGHEDENCRTIYRNAIAVRKAMPVFTEGDFQPFAFSDDVFGFWRTMGDTTVCVLANRSLSTSANVDVPMRGEDVDDVIQGRKPQVSNGRARVFLWPLGTSVLYFHNKHLLQSPMTRGMGVICHITSVPNGGRPGTLGAPSKRFVDYLAETGQTYWQVLPVNPTDQFGSPYAGLSAFAGNPYLIEGFSEDDLGDLLEGIAGQDAYELFCKENERWLTPFCTFRAIKKVVGESVPWTEWPERYRSFAETLTDLPELREEFETEREVQYVFELQWRELRAYANERGVRIIGDIPMYVSADSSDVWAEREVFDLDEKGHPAGRAGTPPDDFAKDGQLWGNPTYRWDYLKSTGYDWWLRRLSRMLDLYDYVRLDHFLGFSSYYTIPDGKPASKGTWQFGPGTDLFEVAHKAMGDLPFIGEDLGTITPAVRALVAETGFPGMDVILFHNGDPREGYVPAPGKICYTSTHDTQTLLGWVKSRYGKDDSESERIFYDLVRSALDSPADVVIMPLQDVLALDDEARMNVPGKAEGNWSWRADADAVDASAQGLARLAHDSNRARA